MAIAYVVKGSSVGMPGRIRGYDPDQQTGHAEPCLADAARQVPIATDVRLRAAARILCPVRLAARHTVGGPECAGVTDLADLPLYAVCSWYALPSRMRVNPDHNNLRLLSKT
jgi:hypothetical protein